MDNCNIDRKLDERAEALFARISLLIETARKNIASTVNITMVYANFETGKYIVEDEQQGAHRAEYGKSVLKQLSQKLIEKYGRGWSVENLTLYRKFYLVYADSVNMIDPIQKKSLGKDFVNTVYEIGKFEAFSQISQKSFTLSWSHYLILMRIENPSERSFYEIECVQQQWSVRQLQRQVNSSLYERLALSRNKHEVVRLSKEGQTVEKSLDLIKNPLTLEFLGLKSEMTYSESKLETAIIDKLQDFLLELGKGFLFEASQKRFTFNEEHFFVDLVFYNRLLQCYCLIDLKIDKLTHQDLGQMQMYVNYYDRYVKQSFEKPTIGILLCKEQNEALVKLTLPDDANIYATQYALYLPNKQLLQAKLNQWAEEFKANHDELEHP